MSQPTQFALYESRDDTESSFFPVDHPKAAFLSTDTEGLPMKPIGTFCFTSTSQALAEYRKYADSRTDCSSSELIEVSKIGDSC